MSVSFLIYDEKNKGSITVQKALDIGINFSQYVLDENSEDYDEFLQEKIDNFECIPMGIEGKSARGFELTYSKHKECYVIRILAFSSIDDYLSAFEYMKNLCTYLENDEIVTDDDEKYKSDNIETYDYENAIKHQLLMVYNELSKSDNDEAYFEFQGLYRNVAINLDILENSIINSEDVVEKYSQFVTHLQYINAYSANQNFYQSEDGSIICVYALTETVPTILPYAPSVEYKNKDIVSDDEVSKWAINLVIINGDANDISSYENIGQVDYKDFIKRLPHDKYSFIDAKYILVQPLNKEQLRYILDLINSIN